MVNTSASTWQAQIEKAKDKSRKLLRKVVAVDTNGMILVGKLEDVSVDTLFKANYPFVKLTLSKARKYSSSTGKLDRALPYEEICFANKPEMVMDIDELSSRYPEIHKDTHLEMKRGRFD
jgi:hypothetical protein